jgi:tRNA pseudouridine55 synthase
VTGRSASLDTSPGSGLLVVDKPGGMTSHDVVARVRRLAGTRKVGHAGTLDPMATGVLLLGVNKATRLLGHLALTEKSYEAVVRLGAATTTDDAEGEVLTAASPDALLAISDAAVREAAEAFVGDIQQVPSAVSAIKVDGQRAYKRVRAGEAVELPPRPVTVHEITLGPVQRHDGTIDVPLTVRCSSGTYVRAIARDLGAVLGVGGHLVALRRTAVGPMRIDRAVALSTMEEAGHVALLPMADAARSFFPCVDVDEAAARAVGFGQALELPAASWPGAGPVAVIGPTGEFLALYDRKAKDPGGPARAVAVFA